MWLEKQVTLILLIFVKLVKQIFIKVCFFDIPYFFIIFMIVSNCER